MKFHIPIVKSVSRQMITILLILTLPTVLILRACRYLGLHFRFGEIKAYILGHFVFDIEYYLRKRSLDGSDSIDLFFISGDVSNAQWLKMIKRNVYVSPVIKILFKSNRLLPNYQMYEVEKIPQKVHSRDYEGIFDTTELQIRFTKEEDNEGKEFLRYLGLENNDKFACLIVRDHAYKNSLLKNRDWSYHDYRDSNIDAYIEAATALAGKGYWVFRMGKVVDRPFVATHPRVIDYASSEVRSDFLDVWLTARCAICISTGTGLDEISGINSVPTVFTNLLPLTHIPLYKFSLTVPKKLVWGISGRLLTIDEYMQHGHISSDEYEKEGIKIIDLTSEEICAAVMEMELVITGQNGLDPISFERQEKLIQMIFALDLKNKRRFQYHRDARARIGSDFLDQYWDDLMPQVDSTAV